MIKSILLLITCVSSISRAPSQPEVVASSTDLGFLRHIMQYGLNFPTKQEYDRRFQIFQKTQMRIDRANSQNLGYRLGHNRFSTMTDDEKKLWNGVGRTAVRQQDTTPVNAVTAVLSSLPTEVNWVTKGAVTPVQDQASCKASWAFAATAALEGAYFNKKGSLVKFSEQQVIDCDRLTPGCKMGSLQNVYSYLSQFGHMAARDYPYAGKRGECKQNASFFEYRVQDFEMVQATKEGLKQAIAIGPVSLGIASSSFEFQQYSSGILASTNCGTRIDHYLTAVGYGSENGQEFFLLKNSFGKEWGDKGYIRVSAASNQLGMCGIYQQMLRPRIAVFP